MLFIVREPIAAAKLRCAQDFQPAASRDKGACYAGDFTHIRHVGQLKLASAMPRVACDQDDGRFNYSQLKTVFASREHTHQQSNHQFEGRAAPRPLIATTINQRLLSPAHRRMPIGAQGFFLSKP